MVGIFDALTWLAKVYKAGFKEFTSHQLIDAGLFDIGCYKRITQEKFIISTGKEKIIGESGASYTIEKWIFNIDMIKRHQYRYMFEE